MKLKELIEGKIEHEKYNIYFSEKPFKSIGITLKKSDNQGLFTFTCFEGTGRWLFGMTKTSYYQNNLYEKQFNGDNNVEDVIKAVDEILLHLSKILENSQKEITSKEKLIECINNLMGVFDNPIARRKINGGIADEARKQGREILEMLQNAKVTS